MHFQLTRNASSLVFVPFELCETVLTCKSVEHLNRTLKVVLDKSLHFVFLLFIFSLDRKMRILPYMRAMNADEAEEFRRETEAGDYDLLSYEVWWRDRNHILEDHGYQLRPRLRPGWVPSWKDTDLNPRGCEDHLYSAVRGLNRSTYWI